MAKAFCPRKNKTQYSQTLPSKDEAHLNLAKIGGRWNWEEKLKSHINWLELKAAFLALQAFLPQLKHQHVQIGIDNKTAMTYINKLGGTRSHRLTSLALEMWNFAADRNLTLSAVYVPGEENQIADKKSRVFQDSLEWMLHPAVFQALQKEVGCFSIDLFATRVNHQVPAFVSWRPEPEAVATDAFNVKWDFQLAYLFPPFCMIKRCLRKIQQDQAHCVLITPVWKSSPWYPVISVSRATIASAKTAGSSETSRHRKDTPPVPSKKLQAGCMAHFRPKLAKERFSQKVSDILLSSWRKKTASQYESAWKAWSGWCSEREINPFSTTLENIFEFLADLFHKGFKFRTLGVYRSAISSNHETVDGFAIGKHPMMAKFMKGVFSLRPPEPKFFVTWDVRQVLDFLKTWSPAESLSLKQLTLKLVMLAALITAARSSSVNKMNLCFRYFKPHGVLFKVPGLTKCAGPKRPLQNLFLASFPPDRRLCFVNYLKQYEKVTKNLRQKTENTQNLSFISYVKPHKPVTSATIARWVKTVLSLAGIDGVFTAHSTRGASASAAARARVALSDIMEAADWSRESTFKKFYHRPTQKSAFTMGVLRGRDSSDSGESGTDQVDSLR